MVDVSLENKFCNYFKKLRWSNNEIEIFFNNEEFKINVSLYSDQKLNLLKEKREIDLFARKKRLHKQSWNTDSKIIMKHLESNHSDVLSDRLFRYVSTFEFLRKRQTDKTNWDIEIDSDWQFDDSES